MKKSKILFIRLFLLIAAGAGFKIYSSVPKQLETLISPDGKITATIYIKSGDMMIETNRSNPMTLAFDHRLDYGAAAFSSDSRYLYVMPQTTNNGYVECRDFEENKSFSIFLVSVIRASDQFASFAADNNIEECREQSITAVEINEDSIADIVYTFKDEEGKEHSISVQVDLYNQQIETIK